MNRSGRDRIPSVRSSGRVSWFLSDGIEVLRPSLGGVVVAPDAMQHMSVKERLIE